MVFFLGTWSIEHLACAMEMHVPRVSLIGESYNALLSIK